MILTNFIIDDLQIKENKNKNKTKKQKQKKTREREGERLFKGPEKYFL